MTIPQRCNLRPQVLFLAAWLLGLFGLPACGPSQPMVQAQPTQSPQPQKTPDPSTIRLTIGAWQPYTGEDLPHHGCDAWVATEAFALAGIKVEYGFYPWARAYQQAADGAWDGTLDWADTPEHRKLFYLSADYISKQEWRFFYRADRPFNWNTLDDLAGKTVGVTSGYVYSNQFKGLEKRGTVKFETASSDIANFQRLIAGRIDVFPMEDRVGRAILASNFTAEERSQVKEHPKSFDAFYPYLLLSRAVPQNEQRIALFNQGLAQLKKSGRYAEMMKACSP